MTADHAWERRVTELWAAIDGHEPAAFVEKMRELTGERPPGDAIAAFELASANDSVGYGDAAVPLYRSALEGGLPAGLRRRAVIQLASTLRNLGELEESLAYLRAERGAGSDDLDDAVVAFLALALVDAGREKEAASLALTALSRHLPRYNRSLANYARELLEGPEGA